MAFLHAGNGNLSDVQSAEGSSALLQQLFSQPYCARELLQQGQLQPMYADLTNTSLPYNFTLDPFWHVASQNNKVSL